MKQPLHKFQEDIKTVFHNDIDGKQKNNEGNGSFDQYIHTVDQASGAKKYNNTDNKGNNKKLCNSHHSGVWVRIHYHKL